MAAVCALVSWNKAAAATRPPSPAADRGRGRRRDTLPQPAEAEWTGGDGQRMPRPVGVAGSRVVTRRRHLRLTRREQLRNRREFVAARLECGDDAGESTVGVPPAAVGVEQNDRAWLNVRKHLVLDRSRRLGEGRIAG